MQRREFVKEAAEKFGDQCVVVAIDAKRVARLAADSAGRSSPMAGAMRPASTPVEYAREVVSLGAGEILLTSMDRDGTGSGFDIPLTRAVADAVSVPVIASGGVGSLDHLVEGIRDGHATAVLAARSSISASIRSGRPRTIWPAPDCRCALISPVIRGTP